MFYAFKNIIILTDLFLNFGEVVLQDKIVAPARIQITHKNSNILFKQNFVFNKQHPYALISPQHSKVMQIPRKESQREK